MVVLVPKLGGERVSDRWMIRFVLHLIRLCSFILFLLLTAWSSGVLHHGGGPRVTNSFHHFKVAILVVFRWHLNGKIPSLRRLIYISLMILSCTGYIHHLCVRSTSSYTGVRLEDPKPD